MGQPPAGLHGTLPGNPVRSRTGRGSLPKNTAALYEATRANIKEQKNLRHAWAAAQLHDKVLFMANTGIRPDEANWLEYRDVEIVEDDATG